jgi:OmcA/MtrC family decaheme c-type cytochrome
MSIRWDRFLAAVLCTAALTLAGCSGDDGDNGRDGAAGADGDPGLACWDLNQNGVPDFPDEDTNNDGVIDVLDCQTSGLANPVESCAVCHGDGSIGDAVVAHALPPIESVSNIAFAVVNAGADLAVTFDVAADGNPATTYDEVQRAYFTDGVTRTSVVADATLANNGGGNYTITIAGAGPLAATDYRWLLRVQDSAERESRTYFYADFPASPFAGPVAVTAEACANCHGPEGIDVHGGAFIASEGGEVCLGCHGSDTVPALGIVAHEYHSGLLTTEEVTYPTYMNNCSVCHETVDQLAAVNAMPINAEGCFSCHGSIAGIPFDAAFAGLHANMNETTDCQGCHQVGGIASGVVAVTDVHNGATTERAGIIWDGVDTSVTEGARIALTITGVADDGTDLTITWQATYDGVGVNPCNATVGAGAPVFFLPGGGSGGTWSILRNYAQGEDFILGTDPDDAGQPGSAVDLDDVNTTCAGNVATTVVPVETTDALYGRIGIQGKPGVVSVADPTTFMRVRAKSPTYDYVVGTGAAAPARRLVVDTDQCLNCHVGSLYQHGGNRVDNVDLCLLCHNTAANDQYVRVDTFDVDASEAYDGRAGQNFGMREMLHAVHSAGATTAPIVIYRGRGIYAWAGDESQLFNWPGTGSQPVFGSDDGTGNPVLQNHNFHTPTYPRGLYECTACHVDSFRVLPDATKAMASTVEAGNPPFGEQVNDVLEGVTASSCMTCHRSGDPSVEAALKAHAYQNGWFPQVLPEGRQTIIDAVK